MQNLYFHAVKQSFEGLRTRVPTQNQVLEIA